QAAAFPQLAQPSPRLNAQFLCKLSPSSLGVSVHALTSPPVAFQPSRAGPTVPRTICSARKRSPALHASNPSAKCTRHLGAHEAPSAHAPGNGIVGSMSPHPVLDDAGLSPSYHRYLQMQIKCN